MIDFKTRRPSLTMRIIANIVLLFFVTAGMGTTAIWFSGHFDKMLKTVTGEKMDLLQVSRSMETALANQKGFVTYYFLDQDNRWLQALLVHRQQFQQCLEQARAISQDAEQTSLLKRIEDCYEDYTDGKDQVIAFYRAGDLSRGEALHKEVRQKFFALNNECRAYRRLNESRIQQTAQDSRESVRQVLMMSIGLVVFQFLLAAWLIFNLFRHVIIPIRQLSRKTRSDEAASKKTGDEITVLKESVYGLIDDMDRTRDELQQSKEMLMHSEKMALVGKLAPVVAHSIRNPMTSINMRLFSLKRNLALTDTQTEDFEVICDEMQRLDHIVQNFLEFSRPPKLRKQKISVSHVMDKTLELLSYRLELHNITVLRKQDGSALFVEADPELLKEVFVNLIVNACDAMENGGAIVVEEKEMLAENIGQAVMVAITDTGTGMSDEMQARVLKPFETTKADGTGLGLFIAVKLVEEHGGTLKLKSEEGKGTTFTIMLPALGEENV